MANQVGWGPLAVDEVFSSLPLGEPVASQGRWGPLAVDEGFSSLPLGEGGPLAVDEGYLCLTQHSLTPALPTLSQERAIKIACGG